MKVGLISFHNAYNYGAALQAYALQRVLDDSSIENEYINYVNKHRCEAYSMTSQMFKQIKQKNLKGAFRCFMGIPFMYFRSLKFESFYKNHLRKTERVYKSSQEVSVVNDMYDKFVVGSDQVWNPRNNGNDTAFLLDFVDDNDKKVSYSSSFGISDIPQSLLSEYKKYLTEIKVLGVREQAGVNLIKRLTGRDATLVLDPVFLISPEQWRSLKKNRVNGRYIFSYTNRKNQFDEFLTLANFDMRGLKEYKFTSLISIKDILSRSKKNLFYMPPGDFIAAIDGSELVVTSSFHCIALSIILNKPFIAILVGDQGKDERVINILNLLGLEDRILSAGTKSIDAKSINYEAVNTRLAELRNNSLEFLLNSISQ